MADFWADGRMKHVPNTSELALALEHIKIGEDNEMLGSGLDTQINMLTDCLNRQFPLFRQEPQNF